MAASGRKLPTVPPTLGGGVLSLPRLPGFNFNSSCSVLFLMLSSFFCVRLRATSVEYVSAAEFSPSFDSVLNVRARKEVGAFNIVGIVQNTTINGKVGTSSFAFIMRDNYIYEEGR